MTRSRRQVEAARKKRDRKKQKKDPGVPQLPPLQQHRQQRAVEVRKRREEAREAERRKRRRKSSSLEGLAQDALRRHREFEGQGVPQAQAAAQPEASLRKYARELRKVLAASDVVLEVLDARDPQGCRSPQLEARVRRAGHRQRLVLVLNKIDLVPKDVVAAWLKHLRGEFPTVAFKACTQQQSHNLKQNRLPAAVAPEEVLAGGGCVGADCLLRVLANYSRSGEVKTTITVGVVGYPNVGKSSLINSLKRSRVCRVGATPGVTRCLQAVQLDRHIQLLDCPGVVMATGSPSDAAPLRGVLDPQRLRDPLGPAIAILSRCPPQQLREVFGVPPRAPPQGGTPPPPLALLAHLARRGGRLCPGGAPDPRAAAVALLRDWNRGKISYYTHPPKPSGVQLEAQILPALGPALDWEALDRGNQDTLGALPERVPGMGLVPQEDREEEEEEVKRHQEDGEEREEEQEPQEDREEEEEEEEGVSSLGDEGSAMEEEEDANAALELGALTVTLKPRGKQLGGGGGVGEKGGGGGPAAPPPPLAPLLEEVASLPPLLQGQGLLAAAKRRKRRQKRAEKLATKLSATLEAAMQL